jgi:hypothetical protein
MLRKNKSLYQNRQINRLIRIKQKQLNKFDHSKTTELIYSECYADVKYRQPITSIGGAVISGETTIFTTTYSEHIYKVDSTYLIEYNNNNYHILRKDELDDDRRYIRFYCTNQGDKSINQNT